MDSLQSVRMFTHAIHYQPYIEEQFFDLICCIENSTKYVCRVPSSMLKNETYNINSENVHKRSNGNYELYDSKKQYVGTFTSLETASFAYKLYSDKKSKFILDFMFAHVHQNFDSNE